MSFASIDLPSAKVREHIHVLHVLSDASLPHLIWTHEGGHTMRTPKDGCMYKPQILSISQKLSRVLTTTEKTLGFVLLSRECSNRNDMKRCYSYSFYLMGILRNSNQIGTPKLKNSVSLGSPLGLPKLESIVHYLLAMLHDAHLEKDHSHGLSKIGSEVEEMLKMHVFLHFLLHFP